MPKREPIIHYFQAHSIHVSAYRNEQADIVRFIDKDKSELDAPSEDECITPLMCAIMGGHAELVTWFVSMGCKSIDARTKDGMTAMHFAAKYGHTNIMRTLQQAGSTTINAMNDVGCTPMHLAAMAGYNCTLKYIASVDPESMSTRTYAGYLPTHVAVENGNAVGLKFLLGKCEWTLDDNINQTVETPMHVAARLNTGPCMRVLLKRGSNAAMMVDVHGWTPMTYALKQGNVLLVGTLAAKFEMYRRVLDRRFTGFIPGWERRGMLHG